MKNYFLISIAFMMMACSRPAKITMNFEEMTNPEVHFQYELGDSTCSYHVVAENGTLYHEITLSKPTSIRICPQQFVEDNRVLAYMDLHNIKPGDDIIFNVKCKNKYMLVDVEGSKLYKEYFGVMNRIAPLKPMADSLLYVMLEYSNKRNISGFSEVADLRNKIQDEQTQIVKEYIQANPSSEASVELFASFTSGSQQDECYEIIDKSLFKGAYAVIEERYLETKAEIERLNAEARAEIEAEAAAKEQESVEQAAANFTLSDIKGKKFSLSALRGKWVVLDFWATWCGPCRESMPHLQEVYEKNDGKFEVVGICCASAEAGWRKLVEEMDLKWINLFNYPTADDEVDVAKLYNVDAFPTYFIINPEGDINKVFVGAKKELYDELTEILK